MENKIEEKEEMGVEINLLTLKTFEAVGRYKSVQRAIRRGHIASNGVIYPRRPFNNRKRTSGRKLETIKEQIYGEISRRD